MNYKQTNETGTVYTRCYQVSIDNGLNKNPIVSMHEEEVFTIGTNTITRPGRFLQKSYNASEVIELVNPETGEPIGQSVSHQELFVMMYSLWLATAKEHDEAEANFVPIDEVQAEELPPNPEPTPE